MSDQPDTIADAVDLLTNPMRIRERYEIWDGNRNKKIRWWEHRMPSLIDQLARAAIPGEVYLEDSGGHIRRMPASCPPARLDAINLELAITSWAADICWRNHIPIRDKTAANLRAIVGAPLTSDAAAEILNRLRRYLHQARIIAGWQRPPWRPDAPCPACDQKGLRVRLDLSTATCIRCGETWDHTTIGVLAEHVRTTTLDKTGA